MNLVSVWSHHLDGKKKEIGGVCVQLDENERASFELTVEGLIVTRAGHSSNCISFHDLLATSEHQLNFLFGGILERRQE